MKVRFMPRSIWGAVMNDNDPRAYIEREMDILPPVGMEVLSCPDIFLNLLKNFSLKELKEMDSYDGFMSYCSEELKDIQKMRKAESIIRAVDESIDSGEWKIRRIWYDIKENVYYAIVSTDK